MSENEYNSVTMTRLHIVYYIYWSKTWVVVFKLLFDDIPPSRLRGIRGGKTTLLRRSYRFCYFFQRSKANCKSPYRVICLREKNLIP